MKKKKAIKFWSRLNESTEMQEIISDFDNHIGYGGRRTLERYVQAYNGFTRGLTSEEVSIKTGWSIEFVLKLPVKAWIFSFATILLITICLGILPN